jgi:tetratricopeptide (TPR) repeat protein
MQAGAKTVTRQAGLLLAGWLAVAPAGASAEADWQAMGPGLLAAWPDASSLSSAYLSGSVALSQNDLGAAAHYMVQAAAQDRDNPHLVNAAFQLTLRSGRMEDALPLAERLLAVHPDNQIANLVLAVDAAGDGDYAAASDRLAGIEEQTVTTFVAPMMEAWLLAGQGAVEEAAAGLNGVGEDDGIGGLARMHEGLIHDQAGDLEAARAAFEEALGPHNSLRLVLALGSVYERLGETGMAEELYRAYQRDNPASLLIEPAIEELGDGQPAAPIVDSVTDGVAEVLFQMASALHGQNATDRALIYARLAQHLRPDFALGHILVGDLLSNYEDYAGALDMYRRVDADAPEAWSARLKLARVLQLQERNEAALAILTEMVEERPDRGEPLLTVGDIHRSERRFEQAVVAYDDANSRSPELVGEDWTFFYRRGIALERSSQWARAEDDLQQAMDLNPDHAHLLNYLGYSWIDRGENLDEAEDLIRRAVELRPDDGFIVDSLGWFYFRTGELDRAVEVLEEAVELEPEDAVINDHLGDAYWMVGRELEARFQWRRALRTLEDDPELATAIRDKLANGLTEPEFVDTQSAAVGERPGDGAAGEAGSGDEARQPTGEAPL